MLATVNGIPVHYRQHGSGTPVLGLHGAGVDHRELMGAWNRCSPTGPAWATPPTPKSIDRHQAVLELLVGLVEAVIGPEGS